MDKVQEFFHNICPQLFEPTLRNFKETMHLKYKSETIGLDISTEGDTDNEDLIKKKIRQFFPNDRIISEETLNDTSDIDNGRVWIVDPICGSANFKNGIKFFCTNIALAEDGKLISSCVVDYSRGEYIWSVGNNEIFMGNEKIKSEKQTKGIQIDIDMSALVGDEAKRIDKHLKAVDFLLKNKGYYLSSFDSSLIFLYVALGRIDGYANGHNNIWDVAAANFLIEQAGGKVTELSGKPWTLNSDNCLAALKPSFHEELLQILNQ